MIRAIIILLSLIYTTGVYAFSPSHLVIDMNSKDVVSASNEYTVRPIASVTKLMTALIVVEFKMDMHELVDYRGGIWRKKKVSRAELLESLLIKSDNAAAEALANSIPGGRSVFLDMMNSRARSLGMKNTYFDDPSGLSKNNVSTALDLAILVNKTYDHPEISSTSSSKYFKIEVRNKRKITYMTVGNTNSHLLSLFDNITLSKTGFTNPAGRCLAMVVEKHNRKYIIVILGEKTSGDRFYRARNLINMVSE